MILTEFFRLRKPEGTDPVNVEDFNDNFDVIDTELNNRPTKTGAATNMVTVFSQASARANLTSGETIATSFGKLMKWFEDLKTVAFSGSYSDLSSKPTLGTSASHTVVEDYDDAAAITEAGYVTGGKVAAAIIKKLSNHFEISEDALSSYTLATAIGLLLANASEKGTYSGRFKCSSGRFTFHCYYAGDSGYNSGYVCSISDGPAYTFYCKAGADAVLKKLGSGLKLTGYSFSINVGGISNTPVNSNSRSGSASLSLDVSEYDSLSIGSYTIDGDGDHLAWGPDDHITVKCTVDGTATTIGTGGGTIDVSGASKAVITVGFSDNQSATYGCWATVVISTITAE